VAFADQIAQFEANMTVMAQALTAVDNQIAALTQPQQPTNKG
jgi:hypothetical protein